MESPRQWNRRSRNYRSLCRLFALLFVAGCTGEDQSPTVELEPRSQTQTDGHPKSPQSDDRFAPPGWKSSGETRERWDVIYMQESKVGYQHTRITPVTVDGKEFVKTDVDYQLAIKRNDQLTETRSSSTSLETRSGGAVWFRSSLVNGAVEIRSRGFKKEGKLKIETKTLGRTQVDSIDWDESWGGFYAVDQSLTRKPMKPGETRKLRFLLEGQNVVADIEMNAAQIEKTAMLVGQQNLLRIDATIQMAGTNIEQTMWTDGQGEVLKVVVPAVFNMTVYRTTEEIATRKVDEHNVDIGKLSLVRLKRQLNDPHSENQIVYRARLQSGKIEGVFSSGLSQAVKVLNDGEAELTVRAVRPGQPPKLPLNIASPTADDLEPNSLIQSDNARIEQMAEEAVGEEHDVWQAVLKLERYVQKKITKKNFSQAIATAADVALNLEGDCTEHAVLLAALCRARKIPARVAVGLVHFRDRQGSAFAFHMWNEVWVEDRWVPMDATLGRGGIGAGHLKLADSSLKGASPFSVFVPVLNVIGQLELEIVKAE